MHAKRRRPRIPLPKGWPRHVKSAALYAISLAHYAIVHARGQAAASVHLRFAFWGGASVDLGRADLSLQKNFCDQILVDTINSF